MGNTSSQNGSRVMSKWSTAPPPAGTATAPAAARLRRYPHPAAPKGALRGMPSSESVTAGGLLFVSDLTRPMRAAAGGAGAEAARYQRQAKAVLEDLERALARGGAGPRDLVSLSVRLKDSDQGHSAFCEALRGWLGGAPGPAVSIGESYMGGNNTLVGVSAVAMVAAGAAAAADTE